MLKATLAHSGSNSLSASAYNFFIGLTLLWGLGVNAIMVQAIPVEALRAIPMWAFLIGYFACGFAGIYINSSSQNPLVSFLGYNLVVLPMGSVLCLVLPGIDPSVIQLSILQTAMAVGLMVFGAVLFPALALSLGRFLFVALLGLIVAQLVTLFVFKIDPPILNVIGVAIFCGYIAYDWAKAQTADKTMDNAVDAACAIYMDIINLFMHLLRLNSRD